MTEALRNEKAVGRDTQGGMVMKTLPAPALVMREAELLLEFLSSYILFSIDQKSGEICTGQTDLQSISFKSDRLLAIPPGCQKTATKWLVMRPPPILPAAH